MGPELAEIAADAESMATPVAQGSSLHGPRHWHDVARVALVLQSAVDGADLRSLFLFAALHDTQRLNDGYDPDHGTRAAAVLESRIGHGLGPGELDLLLYALRQHTGARTHDDPMIAVCWDADRLTLDRVRITPERRYMSTFAVQDDLPRFHGLAQEIRLGPDLAWPEIAEHFGAEAFRGLEPGGGEQ